MRPGSDVNYAADPYGYPPAKGRRRGLFGLGFAVVGIAAFAGVIVFAYGRGDRVAPDGGPPLLEADATPHKLRPEQPGGLDVPHQDKLVYDRLNGKATTGRGTVEHLLPPPEQPLPRPVVTPALPPPPALPAPPAVAQVPPPPPGATATVPRTMPDGDAIPPAVPVPGVQAQVSPPPAMGGASPQQVATLPPPKAPPAPPAKTVPPQPAPAAAKPAAPPPAPATAQPAGALSAPQAAKPPAPATAPASGVLAAPQAAKPAAAPPPAASGGAGGYRVQLASVRSEAEAQAEWKRLAGRYGDALGGLSLNVAKADLGEKGVFYRVQGGSVDEARARAICDKLKAQSVGCVIVRP
ncbi:SPOR domain-containing protein [Azospirillum sp.]|uniref:SPOR domain-containing protein n=1 Tax=Azospirillum sp. TaxID=34012 RepID=UPI002D33BA4C|nr:SPOR domain-containing protein [Azospirillum sp.]HYD68024.1 SPOR domain-containing protein [Azospirillum sp.]